MAALFFTGFLLCMSLCFDLGIVNVSIMRAGVRQGISAAFMVGLGSSFGDFAYALLSMIGIAALLQFSWFRWFLWVGGTLVLLYLAIQMIKETRRPKSLDLRMDDLNSNANAPSLWRHFWTGLGLALASPTSLLWFLAAGGSLIAATAGHLPFYGMLVFFLGFFAASVSWSYGLACVSGLAGRVLGAGFVRVFSLLSAVLYVYFAAKVFWHGWATLANR